MQPPLQNEGQSADKYREPNTLTVHYDQSAMKAEEDDPLPARADASGILRISTDHGNKPPMPHVLVPLPLEHAPHAGEENLPVVQAGPLTAQEAPNPHPVLHRYRRTKAEVEQLLDIESLKQVTQCGLNRGACTFALTTNPEHATTHFKNGLGTQTECSFGNCTRAFKRKGELLRHIKQKHWLWRYVCGACGQGFYRTEGINTHDCQPHGSGVRCIGANEPPRHCSPRTHMCQTCSVNLISLYIYALSMDVHIVT
ncbi:hypothetical protein BD413DRAFT_673612, partial [Trametes elegans]